QMPRTLPIRAPKLSLWAAVGAVSLARNDHFQLVSRLATEWVCWSLRWLATGRIA
ncbi:MAG: hypothetical protein QOF20_699, partial [Acidimicrobiaceae bacterium]|nr:hypothetical protein [Acidimicrobiaceae bacterium]